MGDSRKMLAVSWKCASGLIGVTPEQIALDERSVAELAYATYLQTNASRDDWFNAHVIMIARAYVGKLKSQADMMLTFLLRDGRKLQSYTTKNQLTGAANSTKNSFLRT